MGILKRINSRVSRTGITASFCIQPEYFPVTGTHEIGIHFRPQPFLGQLPSVELIQPFCPDENPAACLQFALCDSLSVLEQLKLVFQLPLALLQSSNFCLNLPAATLAHNTH